MMALPFLNQTALGNITNFSYFMLYLMSTPPFMMPTKSRIPEEHTVLGYRALLPCGNVISPASNSVRLILWYKGDAKTPFYTIDARKVALEEAKHFNSPDQRFNIDLIKAPFQLGIDYVLPEDEGIYRCRIEFKSSPTESYSIRLVVIVPPKKIDILDKFGISISGQIGPFDEDTNIILNCIAFGGNPPPVVTWWHGSSLVDKSLSATQDVVTNELSLVLKREHLLRIYTCIASNTNKTVPLAQSVTIDMNLRPLGVAITTANIPLHSGKEVTISCESWGSKPPCLLSWWLNGEKLHLENESFAGNISRSSITISPNPEDDGKTLVCRTGQSGMTNDTIEYGWTLIVFYVPILDVVLGPSLQEDRLIEGMDIYFECHIKSNPAVKEVLWFFGREQLYSNASTGVILSNRFMVIQRLQRTHSGRYQCSAENELGQGWSEPLFLQVRYIPECSLPLRRALLLSPGETRKIECNIDAIPPPNIFYWSWDHVGDTANFQSARSNHISYNSSQGYGVLKCWSSNSIGTQSTPCEITILRQDSRNLHTNCHVTTVNNTSLLLNCSNYSSDDGKLTFYLEVYSSTSLELLANMTSKNLTFLVEGVPSYSEISLFMYASKAEEDAKPISWERNLVLRTSNATANQIAHEIDDSAIDIRLLVTVLICLLAVLCLVGFSTALIIKKLRKYKSQRRRLPPLKRSENKTDLSNSSEMTEFPISTKRMISDESILECQESSHMLRKSHSLSPPSSYEIDI